jgi:hypothetical protein
MVGMPYAFDFQNPVAVQKDQYRAEEQNAERDRGARVPKLPPRQYLLLVGVSASPFCSVAHSLFILSHIANDNAAASGSQIHPAIDPLVAANGVDVVKIVRVIVDADPRRARVVGSEEAFYTADFTR